MPLEKGAITDDTRIRASLPTLEHLLRAGARLVLASHLGRPKKGPAPDLSLKPVAERLAQLVGRPVPLAPDCVGPAVKAMADGLPERGLMLLENVRFHPEEEKNDDAFAARLVADTGCTVFVNDAFGAAHRAHASVVGVPALLSRRAAGRLLVEEVEALSRLLGEPELEQWSALSHPA